MNKEDIARIAASKAGTTLAVSEKITQEILNAIMDAVIRGESVQIRGFGTFSCVKKAQRFGMDINKNEARIIPPKAVPAFSPSMAFKKRVNDLQGGQNAN